MHLKSERLDAINIHYIKGDNNMERGNCMKKHRGLKIGKTLRTALALCLALFIAAGAVAGCSGTSGQQPPPTTGAPATEAPATGAPATEAPATEAPATDAQPANTGVASRISISRPADSDDLDPVTQDGNVNIWLFTLAIEGLVKCSDDGTQIEPYLATHWEISPDQLTYTFHLLPNLVFSDGSPVTKEDWEWTFERARDPESTWAFALDNVDTVTAPDDQTVVVHLNETSAAIFANLAMFNLGVQSKAYFDKVGPEGYHNGPVGTGPYMFTEWKKGESVLMTRNPNYRTPGLPKTDEIIFTLIPDDNTRIMQLEAGQADIATFVPWNRMDELSNTPGITAAAIPSTETNYIQFNTTGDCLSDQRVRQALDYATDKEEIIQGVFFGYAEPAGSFMTKFGMYWDSQTQSRAYDPDKAKSLLAEAGYPDGFDLTITLPSGNTIRIDIATILKEQWAKVGVNLSLELMDAATATQKLQTLKSELQIRGWTNDTVDPSQVVGYATQFKNSKNFYTGWNDPVIEAYAEQALVEMDDAKRQDLYRKIQQGYIEATPMIPLVYVPYGVAYSDKISGFVQTPLGNYRFENLVKNK